MSEKNSAGELRAVRKIESNPIEQWDPDQIPSFAGVHFSTEEWNALNQSLIEQFRAHQGRIVEGMFRGAPILLLSTTGARSGKRRVTPLMYTCDGERYVVLASKLGAPTHPAWYYNLVTHPLVTVEVGLECFQARAVVVSGRAYKRLFKAHVIRLPNFVEYQRHTTRIIPVVVLDRLS